MTVLLGIDVGTFQTKGVLVGADGRVLARSVRTHGISTPRPGFVEQNPETEWWDDVCGIAHDLCASPLARDIAGIAISALGPCVVATDAALRPLRPAILYGVDQRSARQVADLNATLGVETIERRCGNMLSGQSAGPKIKWLRDEEPSVWGCARWFMTSQSWLVARLTGVVCMDHATAGYFHPLYDLDHQTWNIAGCEEFVDLDRLPPLAWACQIAGAVTPAGSRATGIPVGVPVLVGTTDSPAEAVGAGVVDEGAVMAQYGSSGFFIRVGGPPQAAAQLWAAPFVFEGTSVLAAGTSTAGTVTRWICDILGIAGVDDNAMFGALASLCEQSEPGAHGLLMLPLLAGERTPFFDPDSRGALVGLALQHTRADVARAALEGVGHSMAEAIGVFERDGIPVDRVTAIGGGTKNPIIVSTVSTVTGFTQNIAATDGAAYGDAFLAALATGVVEHRGAINDWVGPTRPVAPQPAIRQRLVRDHEDYLKLYAALADVQHERTRRVEEVI